MAGSTGSDFAGSCGYRCSSMPPAHSEVVGNDQKVTQAMAAAARNPAALRQRRMNSRAATTSSVTDRFSGMMRLARNSVMLMQRTGSGGYRGRPTGLRVRAARRSFSLDAAHGWTRGLYDWGL